MTREATFAIALLAASIAFAPGDARADEKTECSDAANQAGPMRSQGKLKAAREKLIRCAQASCPKIVRDDCANDLRAVDAELPSVVVRASDAKGADLARVRVEGRGEVLATALDGNTIALDPGPITLRLSADGYASKDVELVIARGEKARVVKVVLDLKDAATPAPTPDPKPIAGAARSTPVAAYVLLGVGGASLVAFGVLEGLAQSEYSSLKSGCGATRSCSDDQVAPARAKFVGAGVALGVGAATALAGLGVLLFASPSVPARASLVVSPFGASVRGAF